MNQFEFEKPEKQWNKNDWHEYYRDPQKFAECFTDYRRLEEEATRHTLSSSQLARMQACAEQINGLLSD